MTRTKKKAWKSQQRRPKRTKEEWEAMKKENPDLDKSETYKLAPKTNKNFEAYYKSIGIMPEEEWDLFLNKMREPLPATFRITGSRSQAQELLKIIKGQYFQKFMTEGHAGQRLTPKSLPWYPDEMAWQLDFTKKEIRQNGTLKSLHGFLISETESGNISRQEAVSMLPPLLLDIKPHHKILDMCAAPGSKTAQLIEMLHSDENIPVPDGFVVANDMDNKRCYLMTHQVKRIQSPNCMIINHDARILPNLATSTDRKPEFVKYDRILCDVPCSGDGTMRKNPDIWSKWHVNGGYNLHRIQKKILQRGLDLLAVGGRLVYSTCSLNPVENEAVILTIIKKNAGAVELVDMSDQLPGLVYSKGTYSWKVMSKKPNVFYETVDQAPPDFRGQWDDTMYPPIITEAQDAKLERCIRVLPHQQNTGAFFIAVLQKTRELGSAQKADTVADLANAGVRVDGPEFNSKYFSLNETTNTGRFAFAKCLLCKITLMKHRDYRSHGEGKKHKKAVEIALAYEEIQIPQKNVVHDNDSSMEIGIDTSKADSSTAGANVKQDDVKKETDAKASGDTNGAAAGQGVVEAGKVEPVDDRLDGAMGGGTDQGIEAADNDTADGEPLAKRPRVEPEEKEEVITVKHRGHREDPFHFCAKDDPIWPKIKKYFDISATMDVEQMMFRNKKRVLYYVSQPVRNIVICNKDRGVKFINLGVKCFSNAPSPLVPDSDYRLSQEGLQAIEKLIQGRRVSLTRADMVIMLSQENPFVCKLSEMAQQQVHSIVPGSSIFEFNPSESDPEPRVRIVFCGWRGKTTVRSFVSRDERSHYLRLCGVELTDIQAKVQEEKAIKDLADSPSNAEVKEEAIAGTSGTVTPMGVPSGDEEEVRQWNEGEGPPRGTEEDEQEDSNGAEG